MSEWIEILNPIENVWGDMVSYFHSRQMSRDAVFQEALHAWECSKIRPNYWQKLSDSMPDRLLKVVQADGNSTKY